MTWKQRSKNRRQRREQIQAKEDRKALATRRVINLGTAEAGPVHPVLDQPELLARQRYLRSLPRPNQGTAPHHTNPRGSTVKPPWFE